MSETARPTPDSLSDVLSALRDAPAPDLRPGILPRLGLADRYGTIETPLGPVYVAYSRHGVSAVMRVDDAADFEEEFRRRMGRPVYPVAALPERLRAALVKRLETGTGNVDFDLSGLSEFERAVLRKALEIPRGQTRPYSWIAREIGRPRAVRAVGTALARNPVPLWIPCHRVVRTDGSIGEYGMGGPVAKRAMLAAEGVNTAEVERWGRAGTRFLGSDSTHIYCFPTCHNARRITEPHRQPFASAAAAEGAGYRPCRVCRPA